MLNKKIFKITTFFLLLILIIPAIIAVHNPHDVVNNPNVTTISINSITVVGANCDSTNTFNSKEEITIGIPENGEYEIYGKAQRGSITEIQTNESYFIEINNQSGPISEDDEGLNTFSTRIDYLGKFNLNKGNQRLIITSASQCPPDRSKNGVSIDAFYLLPLPIQQPEPQPPQPPQETGNLKIINVNVQAGLQLHAEIEQHLEIPIDTTNTTLKIEITIQNQLQRTKINNILVSIKSDSLSLDTAQQIDNLIPSQSFTIQLEKDIFNSQAGLHTIAIKAVGKDEDNKDYEDSFIFHINYKIFACSDKIDNDNDHLIDSNDPGCESQSDNDETNSIAQPPEDNHDEDDNDDRDQDEEDNNDEQNNEDHGKKSNTQEQYYNCEEIYHDQPNQLEQCQEKYTDYRQTLSEENNKIVLLNYENDITKQISNNQIKTTKMPTLKLSPLLIIFIIINLLFLILIILLAIKKH